MPIKPENCARYPSDWKQISLRIRKEAGNRCEWCNAPNGEIIARGEGVYTGQYMLANGETYRDTDGSWFGMSRGSEFTGRMVKIVLTVAHLDHQPENVERSNLAALCQKCHLNYDKDHHAKNRADTRRKKLASGDLFDIEEGQP